MSRNTYAFSPPPAKGGLIHVPPSASQTEAAFFTALRSANLENDYFFWAADEGLLYAEALHRQWKFPLGRLLLAKARDAPEVWRIGLETVQTGLFRFVFLRALQACQTAHLRKLQLVAEKMRCEVFLLTPTGVPHWLLKETVHANPLPKKSETHPIFGGELLHPHAQGVARLPTRSVSGD